MAISTYAELQSFVTAHLTLDSTTAAQLPSLIQLAEAELSRLVMPPDRDTLTTVGTVAGTQTVALPGGLKEMQAVLIADDYPLAPVALTTLLSGNSDSPRGAPQSYCIANNLIYLSPIPDAVYVLSLFHRTALPPLATNGTNWLLSKHPDAYVYAVIYQTEAYLVNDDRAARAKAVLADIVSQINSEGNRARTGRTMRLRSAAVV